MHHSAAEDFEPVLAFAKADFAALTAALDVDFHRRFRERKKRRPEPHLDALHLEERLAEFLQHPFQIAEIGRSVDDQTLDLVELRRMGLVGIDAIGPARTDDTDRRFLRQHRANLHRARMRAQQFSRPVFLPREEERVVHLARGMAFGEVQFREVVVVGLDIGSLGDRETEIGEDRDEFVHHLTDRMDAAGIQRPGPDGQRHVDLLRGEAGFQRLIPEDRAPRRKSLGHDVLKRVDRGALRAPLVGRHFTERRQQRRDAALLAERADAHGFERGLVGRGRDGRKKLRAKLREVRH